MDIHLHLTEDALFELSDKLQRVGSQALSDDEIAILLFNTDAFKHLFYVLRDSISKIKT